MHDARPGARTRARIQHGDPGALLTAARAGDQMAWAALVRRYDRLVRAAVRRFALSRADVDDIVQTTWMRFFERGHSLREPAALPGWLATTARREAMRLRTRVLEEEPHEPARLPESPEKPVAEAALVAAERRDTVRRAVTVLGGRRRELLELMLREPELSHGEMASRLGMPRGSIGPTRQRSLDQLRRHGGLADLR
jgi:RNA polymerase sigma factor (sigma-70 family)